jgi:CubicO group peptidase (beta-lactamase class C family)
MSDRTISRGSWDRTVAGRRAVLIACLALASLHLTPTASLAEGPVAARPEAVGLAPQRLAAIGKVISADIEQGELPGAVVGVFRKGKLAYFDAFGWQDKPAGRKMDKDAIFRVYSMTKPWTSVAAMMLVEDGRIQLTDPISKYLPAFKDLQVSVATTNPATGAISYSLFAAQREPTVQDLLRHTSGLTYDFVTRNAPVKEAYENADLKALGTAIRDRVTSAEMVERLGKAPLASQPGTVWEYSLSTAVLGRVIEAVSGVTLSKFLDERLFKPLGMKDSGFVLSKEQAARVAQPFLPFDPIGLFDPALPPANDLGGEGGVSTAADYLQFCEMLLSGGRLGATRVLSPATIALMTADHIGARPGSPIGPGELLLGTPGYTFGLGFMVRQGDGTAGVPGSTGEYMWGGAAGTYFWVDPKQELAVVFMAQVPFATRVSYRRLIKQLVYAAITD